jgi:hypothetical protein
VPRYTIRVLDTDNPHAGATLHLWARNDDHAREMGAEAAREIARAWTSRFKDPEYELHNEAYPRHRRKILARGKVSDL